MRLHASRRGLMQVRFLRVRVPIFRRTRRARLPILPDRTLSVEVSRPLHTRRWSVTRWERRPTLAQEGIG